VESVVRRRRRRGRRRSRRQYQPLLPVLVRPLPRQESILGGGLDQTGRCLGPLPLLLLPHAAAAAPSSPPCLLGEDACRERTRISRGCE
jgi:hypothetical protein